MTTALAVPTRNFASLLPLAVKARNQSRKVAPLSTLAMAHAVDFEPDPWQRDVLTSTSNRLLLNCSRQTGKSSVSAVLALHMALYTRGSLTLIVCPTLRQSGEMMQKVRSYYHQLGSVIDLDADSESALTLRFPGGSRIVALPGKEQNIRAYSAVKLLILDEAAGVPDALYLAVRPMLAVSGGRLIAPSTPRGQRGWWWDEWNDGGDRWERYHSTIYDCPRISADYIEEERSKGITYFEREFMGIFHEADTAAFRNEDIEAAFSSDLETWEHLIPSGLRS